MRLKPLCRLVGSDLPRESFYRFLNVKNCSSFLGKGPECILKSRKPLWSGLHNRRFTLLLLCLIRIQHYCFTTDFITHSLKMYKKSQNRRIRVELCWLVDLLIVDSLIDRKLITNYFDNQLFILVIYQAKLPQRCLFQPLKCDDLLTLLYITVRWTLDMEFRLLVRQNNMFLPFQCGKKSTKETNMFYSHCVHYDSWASIIQALDDSTAPARWERRAYRPHQWTCCQCPSWTSCGRPPCAGWSACQVSVPRRCR